MQYFVVVCKLYDRDNLEYAPPFGIGDKLESKIKTIGGDVNVFISRQSSICVLQARLDIKTKITQILQGKHAGAEKLIVAKIQEYWEFRTILHICMCTSVKRSNIFIHGDRSCIRGMNIPEYIPSRH